MTETQKKIYKISKKFNVTLLYVFGSRSKEITDYISDDGKINKNNNSDIDFGILYNKNYSPSIKEKVRLSFELGEIFPSAEIDLINISETNAFLALEIIKGNLIYCSDIDFQSEYELYIIRRAADLAHFERQKRKMALGE